MIVDSDGMGDTTNTNPTGMVDYPVVPISPDSMISGVMWKLVMYATGGLMLWSYLKTRHRGD